MNYLWYTGHILSAFAIIVNPYNYYCVVVMILLGQFISRPIGRMKDKEINIEK